MSPISFEVANRINGGLRFGPVCPLIERRDAFRGQYIAAMGLEHASSIRYQLAGVITTLEFEALELFSGLGLGCMSTLELVEMRQLRSEILGGPPNWIVNKNEYNSLPYECRVPALFERFIANTGYIASGLFAEPNAAYFEERIDGITDEGLRNKCGLSFEALSHYLGYLKGLFEDRLLFMNGESGALQTSFNDVSPALKELCGHNRIPLQIEDNGGGEVNLGMSEHRLFSLFNNIISNGFLHGRANEPIIVSVSMEPEAYGLAYAVTNSGDPIPTEYFNLSGNGYPRLFALEKRGKRIPIGMAEIWDISAIANGWLQLDTVEGSTTISGFLPRADELSN